MTAKNEQIVSKLKILCLHGYRQSGNTFKNKLGAFRKIVQKYADLTFITAELEVQVESSEEGCEPNQSHGWWFSKADNTFNAHYVSDICTGFQLSVATVKNAIIQNGPFDGVLGFSQGAALATLLCSLQQQKKEDFGFKFAILIAAFKSRSKPHSNLYNELIEYPSLHIYGDNDKVIPKEMSQEIVELFNSPTILTHSGGHFVPATGLQKKDYVEFMQKMLLQCYSEIK